MILPETFTPDWLKTVAKQFGKTTDLKLLEKVVRALSLLEELRRQDLQFVFKGGTSLILHFDQPRRFSIDIDIVMPRRTADLPALFDAIVAGGQFIRWADDSDRKSHQHVPVEHYKFFYTSTVDLGGRAGFGEEPILLDILYAEADYPNIIDKPLSHPWLRITEPILSVQMPDVNCLLGDKLTAFAPNTTGILYSKNRPLEVVKQLFDVALLFDHATDLDLTRQTFEKLAAQEIAFRQLSITTADVLDDIINTALLLTRRDATNKQFVFLQDGIKRLNNFIVSDFRIEQAILAGSKAAYLSRLLRTGATQIDRYQNPMQIVNWQISDAQFSRLNKLKKVQPEAFFYWYLCFQ